MNRYSPIAAGLVILAALVPFFTSARSQRTYGDVVMAPEGGRLDAIDRDGNVMGPCPLKHTDVDVKISGAFTRVTVKQQYHNPYQDKIEAVYTFPLSHRAAVDRMVMTIGSRVVVGEIKERAVARAIYEAARQQGYVASLLEQERPNIFTQSVANIEPGAEIEIEISYVELLESKDAEYSFDFPMVVGPRYIPGSMRTAGGGLPGGFTPRQGLVLLGPAKLELKDAGETGKLGTLQTGKLAALLHAAMPISIPARMVQDSGGAGGGSAQQTSLWYRFEATYCNGSKELGELYTDGTGQVNGRWFYTDPKTIQGMGTGYSPDTTQVPDASKITPEPVKPGKRSGHDISIRVTIDTGGPAITKLKSTLHEVDQKQAQGRTLVSLKKAAEIPNRDFVLKWRQAAETIQEATFTHTDPRGKFFTLILQPPARVRTAEAVARELIFVLDTSGSMNGFPIEKAKDVMRRAIGALRPQDTFNLITFSGDTHILWDKPRPGTASNIAEAQSFLAARQGRGGTEMMKAINAALVQGPIAQAGPMTPDDLANLPADGRQATVTVREGQMMAVAQDGLAPGTVDIKLSDGSTIRAMIRNWEIKSGPGNFDPAANRVVQLRGQWVTRDRQRVFDVISAECGGETGGGTGSAPIRICCFMTDGYVGNDMQIIDAVRKNSATTRVFSFGIGNSVNRYLLDGMAKAGRGEVEYVTLADDADGAAKRFAERVQTPVLTDVEVQFSPGLKVSELVPGRIPDLFDVKPLILHGQYTGTGKGTVTIRGRTGTGPYIRTIDLSLPESQPEHDTIATLWARAKVEELMNRDLAAAQQQTMPDDLKAQIVRLGETFSIMTQFTSFVAVEKSRVTIGGQPRLVAVPIEMPEGVSYEGVFGGSQGEVAGVAEVLREAPRQEQLGKQFVVAGDRTTLKAAFGRPSASARGDPNWRFSAGAGGWAGALPVVTPAARSSWSLQRSGSTAAGVSSAEQRKLAPTSTGGDLGFAVRKGEGKVFRDKLDAPAGGPRVVPLRNGSAVDVAKAMDGYFANEAVGKRPVVSADAQTNSLIVQAEAEDAFRIQSLVTQLDAGKPMPTTLPALDRVAFLTQQLQEVADQKEWARSVLLPNRVALAVAELVASDKFEDARQLATALAKFDPEFKPGVRMKGVLLQKIAVAEQKRRIADIAAEARQPVEAADRDAKLRRRLDDALYGLAIGKVKEVPAGVTVRQQGLLVTVLLPNTEEVTLATLRKAGVDVETTVAASKFVVAVVPREKLADVALLEPVRRMEVARLQ